MSVAINDILRVAARMSYQGQGDFVNVYHFRWSGASAIDDSDALDYCAARLDKAYDKIKGEIANDAVFVDINVFDITQDRPLGAIEWPTLTTGQNSDENLPNQVAAFVRFPSGYSRNWARKFIGPLTVSANTAGGLIESAALTALTNYANEMLVSTVGSVADAMDFVVRRGSSTTYVPVIEAIVRNVWATVRTRRAGRGS